MRRISTNNNNIIKMRFLSLIYLLMAIVKISRFKYEYYDDNFMKKKPYHFHNNYICILIIVELLL